MTWEGLLDPSTLGGGGMRPVGRIDSVDERCTVRAGSVNRPRMGKAEGFRSSGLMSSGLMSWNCVQPEQRNQRTTQYTAVTGRLLSNGCDSESELAVHPGGL